MFRAQQNAFDDAVGWFLPLPELLRLRSLQLGSIADRVTDLFLFANM